MSEAAKPLRWAAVELLQKLGPTEDRESPDFGHVPATVLGVRLMGGGCAY